MLGSPEKIGDRAEELFQTGLCCAESVLLAVAESRGIKSEWIPKIATGFCGGIARTGNVCGALAGAIMAISLVTGRATPADPRDENHRRIRQLIREFEARYGAVQCRDLIGCRLDTAEGQRQFIENNLRARCAEFTREAARMAGVLLSDA